jgi:two-component system nitrogen regulation response regulator GlnG
MPSGHILLADDDAAIRTVLNQALSRAGYEVRSTSNAATLWRWVAQGVGDLIITDVVMPDENAFDLLPRIKKFRPDIPIIVMSAQNTFMTAIKASERGAYEYLPKPFDLKELVAVVGRALSRPRAPSSIGQAPDSEDIPLVGRSPAMQEIYRALARLMPTDLTVMITGESGTGKELVARALHDYGKRRQGPFVAVNMAAIPRDLIESDLFGHEKGAFTGAMSRSAGRFEQAEGGTLFLDEIGDMSATVQAKLLRALEERRIERLGGDESIPVDVRIVSATHRALEEEIVDGNFRADLFYRLRVVTIEIAPLRERREDIPVLAEAFARQAAERHRLPQRPIGRDALKQLMEYDWPGNVRELRNAIERAAIMSEGPDLNALDLSEGPAPRTELAAVEVPSNGNLMVPYTSDFRDDRREFERRYIARCLEEAGGNVTRAAAVLGMHRQSLQHKLRELGLGRRYVAVGEGAQDKSDK